MSRPGFVAATRTVALKDLRLEWRSWETLSSTLVFSTIVLVVFQFAFGSGAMRELGASRLLPGVIWAVIAFASVVGFARSFHLERPGDTLSALFLAPIDSGAVFVGKMLANLVKLTLLQWILLPLTALFFAIDLSGVVLPMVAVLALHGLGLAELGTLFAALTARVGRGEALLATLLFPAAAPLLLSAVKCTTALLEGRLLEDGGRWLVLTAGADLLYLLIALLTFEFLLEE